MTSFDWIRLTAAFGSLLVLGAAEARWRLDPLPKHRVIIAGWNMALGVIGAVAVRLLVPWVVVDAALWSQQHELGLLHAVAVPAVPAAILSLLLLDLSLYLQHLLMHRVSWLWRLHSVHHGDRLLDVTTGYRFHPLEIVISMLWKAGIVVMTGMEPWVVVAFEIWLNTMSVFTHANLRLPQRFESALGTLFVTPKVHRVHHSIEIDEQHCNFGFDLTAWDRLFGTFRSKSRSGSGARLGLDATQRNADLGLLELLKQPFSPTYLL